MINMKSYGNRYVGAGMKFVYNFLRKIKNGNYFFHFLLYKINPRKIVVVNYHGKGYGDNSKYIINQLINKGYDIVWVLNERNFDNKLPEGIRKVRYGSYLSLKEMATAKIWLDNSRKDYYPPKKTNQYYVQTWHSPLRLKKIEKDAEEWLSYTYIKKARDDGRICDLMVSGSTFSTNLYKKSFWFEGEVLNVGTPRCDIFFDFSKKKQIEKKVKEAFGLTDEKIILYAPTFRKSFDRLTFIFDVNKLIDVCERKFKGSYVLLYRLHPNIAELSDGLFDSTKALNASFYDDMQELLVASDILITDYSSSMFDRFISKEKCFLYANDFEEYTKNNRGLYFDIKELPSSFSNDFDELVLNIEKYDNVDYISNVDKMLEEIGSFEKGTSSIEIANKLEEIMNEKI